jgi:hypothetical protein
MRPSPVFMHSGIINSLFPRTLSTLATATLPIAAQLTELSHQLASDHQEAIGERGWESMLFDLIPCILPYSEFYKVIRRFHHHPHRPFEIESSTTW